MSPFPFGNVMCRVKHVFMKWNTSVCGTDHKIITALFFLHFMSNIRHANVETEFTVHVVWY